MDFAFTSEQEMLRSGIDRLLAKTYDFDARQASVASSEGRNLPVWTQLTEMGVLQLAFSESDGGLGGAPSDMVALGEIFGKYLMAEPYLDYMLLGAQAYRLGGVAHSPIWDDVLSGTTRIALAHEEAYGVGDVSVMATTFDGHTLSGEKRLVLGGDAADRFVVSARQGDRQMLLNVAARAPGVSMTPYQTIDGRQASNVQFNRVTVPETDILAEDCAAQLEEVLNLARLYLAAEAVGAVKVLVEASAEYAATRKQFGKPIGSFQAVAHRLADMKIAAVKLEAQLLATTALADRQQATPRDIALLKAQAGRLGQQVGESAIQVHGGIGMTDELSIGHYFKRLVAIDAMLGNSNYQLRRVGQLT
ncbi:MAG: acyl-CoA dehydrogenase family protein [Pseudomonadota bacterium]